MKRRMILIHCTTIEGFKGIMGVGRILDQQLRRKFLIDVPSGEGVKGRKVGPRLAPLRDKNFWEKFDEGEGIFFRVAKNAQQAPSCSSSKLPIQLIFDQNVLNDTDDWILSTEENNGFVLGVHKEYGESPFSGEVGFTHYGKVEPLNEDTMNEVIPTNAELVISGEVPLKHLNKIVVYNRNVLNALNIPGQYERLVELLKL